ncbi:MAG TPA: TIGR03619 family F420-dependent LLM class oxidoreductase [Candidatus Margulisiibacteriota bacterium]|nr:TIGR03619 family F420-dependent LLM class oxidoreductase [Candidatus Margulisiibacteriota bacterium]
MRFGLSMPVIQQIPGRVQPWETAAGAGALVAVAQAADRLGFSHVSVCDHVAIPQSYAASAGTVWYDAAVTLGFLAAVTTRVRLLSHVMVVPYRHPLVVAKAFATLDHLSGGRVILGAGCGHLKPEFRSLGAHYEERGAITDEYLQAIGVAWENPCATFEGRFVQFREVTVAPRASQQPRPPIWIGGNSRAAVRRAVRHGDGWIPWMVLPGGFAELVAYAHELQEQEGRGTPMEFVAPLSVSADADTAAITAQIEAWRTAGATSFHVGFVHHSLEHLLERMQFFATGAGLTTSL